MDRSARPGHGLIGRVYTPGNTSTVSYGAEATSRMPFSSINRPTQHDCSSCELRSLRMFCNLDAEALADFEAIGVQATLPRGAKLFQEDAPSNGVFVICTGQVKLFSTSREGRTLILKIAMPGDVLG